MENRRNEKAGKRKQQVGTHSNDKSQQEAGLLMKSLLVPRSSGLGSMRQIHYSQSHNRLEPVQYLPIKPFRFTRRYICSAATVFRMGSNELFSMDVLATTTTNVVPVNSMMRIIRLCAWAPCTTQGTPVSAVFVPDGEDSGNSFATLTTPISDTSSDITRPAYIEHAPTAKTPSGAWHKFNLSNVGLYTIAVPSGTVIDVHVEALPSGASTGAPMFAVTGATAGVRYTLALTTNVVPQNVNFI